MEKYEFKIAHINFAAEKSVIETLKNRALSAYEQDVPIDFYIINKDIDDEDVNNCYLRKEKSFFLLDKIHPYAHAWLRLTYLKEYFDPDKYACIVLRYPKLPFDFSGFFEKYGNKIITEHHTLTSDEIRATPTLLRRMVAMVEDWVRPLFLRKTLGAVCLTKEIKHKILEENPHLNTVTIANGINVQDIPVTGYQRYTGDGLKMLFVASRFDVRHGLDRLLKSLENYKEDESITATLLGHISKEDQLKIKNINKKRSINIITTGPVYGIEKEKYYLDINVAVSPLALFRNAMTEACPLKTREYIARGLPFIYAYEDDDVSKEQVFALKLPQTNESINFEDVRSFLYNLSNKDDLSHDMNRYASNKLDWKIKTVQLYNFCAKVMNLKHETSKSRFLKFVWL